MPSKATETTRTMDKISEPKEQDLHELNSLLNSSAHHDRTTATLNTADRSRRNLATGLRSEPDSPLWLEHNFRTPNCILRLAGFAFEPCAFRPPISSSGDHRIERGLSLCWCLTWAAVNALVASVTLYEIHTSRMARGMMDPLTMSVLLCGLKPVRNLLNLLTFIWNQRAHTTLLSTMAELDRDFYAHFHFRAPWIRGARILLIMVIVTFILPGLARWVEFTMDYVNSSPKQWESASAFEKLFSLSSLFLAPMLSVWQLTPLYYFTLLCYVHEKWFHHLRKELRHDLNLTKRRSDFYYDWFIRLTSCVSLMGDFFSLYLFASMAMSVVILCLTIYFAIHSSAVITIDASANISQTEAVFQTFLPTWAGIQITTALIYVICISIAGLRMNESARAMTGVVLHLKTSDERARFNVVRFIARIQTQHMGWGLSIWKALPVERSLLFTLFGLISTYAVLLLKLQKDHKPLLKSDRPMVDLGKFLSNDTLYKNMTV